ncbi:BglG family transcription antiterminator [Vagococcus zengguangii]|uniref:Transcription antiterminator n=1 Tax=Vagococcus zengguangii TaxID=2571750 RepID=A0A4D7CNH7_9ENTE|nr:BglG family transcription antiterminator [Vagococcus zengguangii]QCI85635.1 transcription antiterminator [Vagococcus zengguangii]TLG81575.1 transcription antiterminator [Vagococcus zengguangii]
MKYLLQERMNKILMMIYENDVVPLADIMSQFNISDRTIRNDIKELNAYLEKYGAKIVLLRKKGYTIESKKRLDALYHDISQHEQHHLSVDSLENRIFLVINYLLSQTDYCSMAELCRVVYVSPSTMTSYLRTIKENLERYHLTLLSKNNLGYKITGSEQDFRRYIFDYLIDKNAPNYMTIFSPYEMTLFNHVDLENLYNISLTYFPPATYPFNDYSRKNFIIQTAIMLNRLIQQHPSDKLINDKSTATFANQSLNKMLAKLENIYHINISTNNKKWLLSKIWPNLMTDRDYHPGSAPFAALVTAFIEQIKHDAQLDFSNDQTLINDLNNHLATYLPVKANNPEKINPLMKGIKNKYAYAYKICRHAVKQLPIFKPFKLSEHDIGYIALHIAAALERRKNSQPRLTKVVILCSQGFSTSRLIEAKIKQHFYESINIINLLSYAEYKAKPPDNIDLIISTMPIKRSNIPVFYFDLLHVNKSITLLTEQLEEQNKHQQLLSHLFHPSLFFHTRRSYTKLEAIHFLIEQYNLNSEEVSYFTKNILEREDTNPTNISPFVAIPHIIDEKIKESQLLTLITDHAIKWDSQNSVKIIFLMLISPKDNNLLQQFMDWVSDLLDNLPKQEQLSYATSYQDFFKIISEDD